jgi:hypothetical protein
MSDEDLINLRHDLDRHEDAVTQDAAAIQELKGSIGMLQDLGRRIAALEADIEVLSMFANPTLIQQINQYVHGVPSASPDVKKKCVKFLERHGSLAR